MPSADLENNVKQCFPACRVDRRPFDPVARRFIALLAAHSVGRLVDVRTVPRSRHNPQFNRDTLPAALEVAGIGYAHVAGLGGFRHTHPGSLNMGWRNVSFRGFADYMQTPEFAENLAALIEQARASESR